MVEPTEREKKLVEYLLTMLKILSLYSMAFDAVFKNLDWLYTNETNMGARSSETEIVEYLKNEFNIPLKSLEEVEAEKTK